MPFMAHLDPKNNVNLKWGFSDVQVTITFQLTVKTTGWVGFGLSPNGGMAGADIVIGGVGRDGNYFKVFKSIITAIRHNLISVFSHGSSYFRS